MVTWLIVGEPSGEAGLTVVPQRRPNTRNGGSCKGKGKLVKLALNVVPGSVEVKTKVGVARAAGVRFRLSGAQVRREGRVEYEDPRGEVTSPVSRRRSRRGSRSSTLRPTRGYGF